MQTSHSPRCKNAINSHLSSFCWENVFALLYHYNCARTHSDFGIRAAHKSLASSTISIQFILCSVSLLLSCTRRPHLDQTDINLLGFAHWLLYIKLPSTFNIQPLNISRGECSDPSMQWIVR